MAYYKKWKPSKTQAREFAEKMEAIAQFCREHGIQQSARGDSYYFELNGKKYRVSNHTIENSNARAYNCMGEKLREEYHDTLRQDDTVYIHASKTRIIDIYTDLANGYELDGKGFRK